MGKQNDAFTAYLGRAEVLADLYNGCLYQGEKVVQAGNLCEVQQFYQQGLSERVKRPTARRRERDAIRAFWNEKSYVLLAAEAQNQPHLTMPFRCMEYDLAEYARQLRYIRLKSEGKLKTGVEYLNRISRMDVATYDMICVMLNLKELQELSEKNEKIKEAVETMITLTEDERVRIECMRQEKAERDWINAMNYATEQGEERGEARGMKMGIQKGMKQERENTLKLVAKMSQNGDTEYIARLMEPEVFEQMAAKYGMKA